MSDSEEVAELDDIKALFEEFAAEASSFSKRIVHSARPQKTDMSKRVAENLKVARSVFSKWSIEVMIVLYMHGGQRFTELKRHLPDISSRTLSLKLRKLEEMGLIRRVVIHNRPPSVIYELTEEGQTVTKMGEPVFLYFGLVKRFYT